MHAHADTRAEAVGKAQNARPPPRYPDVSSRPTRVVTDAFTRTFLVLPTM